MLYDSSAILCSIRLKNGIHGCATCMFTHSISIKVPKFCLARHRPSQSFAIRTHTDPLREKRGDLKTFKFTGNDRRLVKEHINSFPRDVGHYNRHRSEKEYLSGYLNVNRLFKAFKEKYPNSKISSKFYRSVFLKDFPNLSFSRPRDTCKTCDRLNIASKGLFNRTT